MGKDRVKRRFHLNRNSPELHTDTETIPVSRRVTIGRQTRDHYVDDLDLSIPGMANAGFQEISGGI